MSPARTASTAPRAPLVKAIFNLQPSPASVASCAAPPLKVSFASLQRSPAFDASASLAYLPLRVALLELIRASCRSSSSAARPVLCTPGPPKKLPHLQALLPCFGSIFHLFQAISMYCPLYRRVQAVLGSSTVLAQVVSP